jgi:hypothetical protein
MPRPGTPVIPVNWSEHHRPTVEKTMTATVTLQRPSGVFTTDEVAGRSVPADPQVLWTGQSRIQRFSRRTSGTEPQVGGRFIGVEMYQVSLPADVPEPALNDQVVATVSGDDPQLVGKVLTVREIRLGSLIWSRDLMCEEIMPATRR